MCEEEYELFDLIGRNKINPLLYISNPLLNVVGIQLHEDKDFHIFVTNRFGYAESIDDI